MERFVTSSDGIKISFREAGTGNIALVFVHGWLGNANWWSNQEEYFMVDYRVVLVDLAGHGKSGKSRKSWTSGQYADDIRTVVNQLHAPGVILIGHSMAGAYVLEASVTMPNVQSVFLVDTLKDMDRLMRYEQADELLFANYRSDFKAAVEHLLPKYLFVDQTPEAVKRRLQQEFLQNDPELAVHVTMPLYKMDIREIARSVTVPVRAINSDASPTNVDNNRKYIKDYGYRIIAGTGHYPMLEKPGEFNLILKELIEEVVH